MQNEKDTPKAIDYEKMLNELKAKLSPDDQVKMNQAIEYINFEMGNYEELTEWLSDQRKEVEAENKRLKEMISMQKSELKTKDQALESYRDQAIGDIVRTRTGAGLMTVI